MTGKGRFQPPPRAEGARKAQRTIQSVAGSRRSQSLNSLSMPFNPSLPETSLPGVGRLRFQRVAGRTAVVESFASSPLKFVHPRNHGIAAWAVASTYGGGLLGGDAIKIDIDLGAETQAVFMTQASTKIYRSQATARQDLSCRVGPGALMVSAQDRVACFANSSFEQRQRYTLAPDANLLLVDWISAGRLDSGERWQLERYASRIEIWRDSRLCFLEALRLDAAHGNIAARMGRFNSLASVILIGPKLAACIDALRGEIESAELQPNLATLVAASTVGNDGLLLRLAGVDVETLGARLRKILSGVCELIGDDPWARRW